MATDNTGWYDGWWRDGHVINPDLKDRFLDECREAISLSARAHFFSSILFRLYTLWPRARVVSAIWACEPAGPYWLPPR